MAFFESADPISGLFVGVFKKFSSSLLCFAILVSRGQ